MKKIIIILITIFSSTSYCCQRCNYTKTVFEEAREASIVVVAKKIKDNDIMSVIEILKILKGSNIPTKINVRLKFGMCHYGLGMSPNLPHVIFLKRAGKKFYKITCSSELPVKGNKVRISGKLKDFDYLFSKKP